MQITKEIAQKLIQESPSFREWIVDEMFNTPNNIHAQVKDIVTPLRGNKIAAIRALRDFSVGKKSEFAKAYPLHHDYHVENDWLGLASAKKIVELYI